MQNTDGVEGRLQFLLEIAEIVLLGRCFRRDSPGQPRQPFTGSVTGSPVTAGWTPHRHGCRHSGGVT